MNGLSNEFDLISMAIKARESEITIKELDDKLIDYESVLVVVSGNRESNQVATNFVTKGRQNNSSQN